MPNSRRESYYERMARLQAMEDMANMPSAVTKGAIVPNVTIYTEMRFELAGII